MSRRPEGSGPPGPLLDLQRDSPSPRPSPRSTLGLPRALSPLRPHRQPPLGCPAPAGRGLPLLRPSEESGFLADQEQKPLPTDLLVAEKGQAHAPPQSRASGSEGRTATSGCGVAPPELAVDVPLGHPAWWELPAWGSCRPCVATWGSGGGGEGGLQCQMGGPARGGWGWQPLVALTVTKAPVIRVPSISTEQPLCSDYRNSCKLIYEERNDYFCDSKLKEFLAIDQFE